MAGEVGWSWAICFLLKALTGCCISFALSRILVVFRGPVNCIFEHCFLVEEEEEEEDSRGKMQPYDKLIIPGKFAAHRTQLDVMVAVPWVSV